METDTIDLTGQLQPLHICDPFTFPHAPAASRHENDGVVIMTEASPDSSPHRDSHLAADFNFTSPLFTAMSQGVPSERHRSNTTATIFRGTRPVHPSIA